MPYLVLITKEDGYYWIGRDEIPVGPYRTRTEAINGFRRENGDPPLSENVEETVE